MNYIFKKCRYAILFSGDVSGAPNANFLKHAGADIDSSALFFSKSRKLLLTSKMNERKAKALCKFPVKTVPPKGMRPLLKKLAPRGKIGLDFESISASLYFRLRKAFSRRIVNISDELENAREAKNKEEISNLRKAVSLTRQILNSLHLSPSMTELEVVRHLNAACTKKGVEFSFPPIVASGKNSGMPHYIPANKKLGNGIVLIDFGVKYRGYCADLTRCYFLGKCIKERKKYQEAKEMFDSLLLQIPKLKTVGDIAKYSKKQMERAKWEIVHSIGHGIGLETHDVPSIYKKNKRKLRDGMVLAIETGWYSKDYGVRFEDNIIMEKGKAKLI